MPKTLLLALLCAVSACAEDYCFGFLNAHPERRDIPKEQAEEIQKGHMAHMGKMNAAGRLLAAGPMATEGGPRGVLVYRCSHLDEAREWTSADPAVLNKRLTLELYRWRATDGFGEPLMSQLKADPKAKMTMVRLPMAVMLKTDKWSDEALKLAPEHVEKVQALIRAGKIRAAGPWVDEKGNPGQDPRSIGIAVYSAMPVEEAEALAREDPLVRAGFVTPKMHVWFVADEAVPKR